QSPRPEPDYSNAELAFFYRQWEMLAYRQSREFPRDLMRKFGAYWRFYLGPLLTIPLLALLRLWRDRSTGPLLAIAAAVSFALVGQVWHNPHYAAPATGLAILIVLVAMRRL